MEEVVDPKVLRAPACRAPAQHPAVVFAGCLLAVFAAACDERGEVPVDAGFDPDLRPPSCRVNADCLESAAPYCDTKAGVCVPCLQANQCSQGFICALVNGYQQCVESCGVAGDCTNGADACCG